MILAYAIHGYGRGHATRALGLLTALSREFEILIFSGGDAFDLITKAGYPVIRIPNLSYEFAKKSSRYSFWKTVKANIPRLIDLLGRGPAYKKMKREFRERGVDLVLSDSEPWSQRVANDLGIPVVSVDHYAIFVYCVLNLTLREKIGCFFNSLIYRFYMGRPDRIIASAFFLAVPKKTGVKTIGPIVRDEIKSAVPVYGNYLLVYFNKGKSFITPAVETILNSLACEVRIYGKGADAPRGNLVFKAIDPNEFTRDLISCRAMFSSGGNQLMGETMWLGKPVLVIPEDSLDQHLNSRGVEQLGIGMRTTLARLTVSVFRQFLAKELDYRAACEKHRKDGTLEAMACIREVAFRVAPGN